MLFLSGLLHAERVRRGTRRREPGVGLLQQAVLVLRWFLDDTRVRNWPATTTSACRPPTTTARGHHGARRARAVAARGAAGGEGGRSHPRDPRRHPDRHRPELHPRPDPRGGSVVVGKAPPPRREHPGRLRPGRLAAVDLRCAPAANTTPPPPAPTPTCSPTSPPGSTTACAGWPTWATKAKPTRTSRSRRPAGGDLTGDQQPYNAVHGVRALGERANSLLKTTFKALRRGAAAPGASAKIVAAALVLLHLEHDRTT